MTGRNNFIGLFLSFYSVRFNEEAYVTFGYGSQRDTLTEVRGILRVKSARIKNWRDKSNPFFGYCAGLYQIPIFKSRMALANALVELDESTICEQINILSKFHQPDDPEIKQMENIVSDGDVKSKRDIVYVSGGITAREAEEFFINQFKMDKLSFEGNLKECHDLCNWFLIESKTNYIEVKGRDVDGQVYFLPIKNGIWRSVWRMITIYA